MLLRLYHILPEYLTEKRHDTYKYLIISIIYGMML
ncbi:MAG: hypothetical protein CFH03_01556 [Alphaproteobacteria bacterium MarineAlpha3_Bin2]|nr:MAG: hypothetical protein CFH03_01556 [Alphaproteobacteria bacterium MarineAlpha3_Bin2]